MRDSTYHRQFRVPGHPPPAYERLGPASIASQGVAGVCLQQGPIRVEVTALAPDLFRVGLFAASRPVQYKSEAVVDGAWDPGPVTIGRDSSTLRVSTTAAAAVVRLDPLTIHFEDGSGRAFAQDDPDMGAGFLPLAPAGSGLIDPLGPPARVYKRHSPSAHYFGCGERTGGLDKTDSHQIFWNVDPPVGHTAALNNLYTSIPFVLALDRGQTWGLFLDNPGRVEFDLARERPDCCWFGTESGDLVYYVFAGPTPRAVVERYTELTGRTPLPPLWALGFHQSRWGYRSEGELLALAREFRAREIPCDALYLDIDYMDGFRVFTWDPERFPDPHRLAAALRDQGFHLVTIVDPGVKVEEQYRVYTEGRDAGYFCRTFLDEEYHNVVWAGPSAFPDFTNSRARFWWGAQHAALTDAGVAGVWCDMNEPTVFLPTPATLPPDVVHGGADEPHLHAEVHNLYGSLMARATREGLEALRPDQRPVVISRSGYAGLQRDALHWTGDNSSWWEHLWMSMPQLQNLGLSGLSWIGTDIGGFAGDATGELVARWTEVGIFQPFCRNHSAWNSRRQEPWAFGEPYESAIREMLRLRQRLIPYLYSLFDECGRSGAPILRPLLYQYPEDETVYSKEDEFLLGDALLVAPIARPATEYRAVYLPAGTWFQFWTGERVDGPAHVLAHAPLGRPAIYQRANAPLPLWPPMNYTGERTPDPLTLVVFPAPGAAALTLYEDEGDGYGYREGRFARWQLSTETSDELVRVTVERIAGAYEAGRSTVELELRGMDQPPVSIAANGVAAPAGAWDAGAFHVFLPAPRERVVIDIGIRNGG